MKPAGGPYLSASEIGAFVYCPQADIGCGAGIDLLLASFRVGPTGRAIGVDLTPEMVVLARIHANELGLGNVEVLEGAMEALALEDASVDVVVSNGVFNLSADKAAAFAEAYRVLRPDGRRRHEGALDALFALVAPEQRWQLVQTATIRAIKPLDADQRPTRPLASATVCRL